MDCSDSFRWLWEYECCGDVQPADLAFGNVSFWLYDPGNQENKIPFSRRSIPVSQVESKKAAKPEQSQSLFYGPGDEKENRAIFHGGIIYLSWCNCLARSGLLSNGGISVQ